jgi:hypothetical protein
MNSLKLRDLTDRCIIFAQQLYNACLGDDEQKKWRACYRAGKLIVISELWETAMQSMEGRVVFGGGLRENLEGLEELFLVMVEYVRDRNGRLYTDNRQLIDEDIEKVFGVRDLRLKYKMEEEFEKSLRCIDGKVKLEFKLLQRGMMG